MKNCEPEVVKNSQEKAEGKFQQKMTSSFQTKHGTTLYVIRLLP